MSTRRCRLSDRLTSGRSAAAQPARFQCQERQWPKQRQACDCALAWSEVERRWQAVTPAPGRNRALALSRAAWLARTPEPRPEEDSLLRGRLWHRPRLAWTDGRSDRVRACP